jgi:F1F0 ATPase subunit 2
MTMNDTLSLALAFASLVLAGFHFVARGRWERVLACLLGFVAARLIATRLTRAVEKPAYWEPEARHAP